MFFEGVLVRAVLSKLFLTFFLLIQTLTARDFAKTPPTNLEYLFALDRVDDKNINSKNLAMVKKIIADNLTKDNRSVLRDLGLEKVVLDTLSKNK